MTRLFHGFKLIALAFVLVFASPAAQACEGSGPAIWQAKGEKGTLYLLGSFHLLTSDVNWWSPTLGRLLMNANSLTMEVSKEGMSPEGIGLIIQSRGMYSGKTTLRERIGDDLYRRLMEASDRLAIPELAVDRFKPWYASLVLSVKAAQVNGFLPEYGVESVLTDVADQRGLQVQGLETADDQLKRLSDYSEEVQIEMLVNVLDEIDVMHLKFNALKKAWCSGEEAALESTILEDFKKFPDLYQKLLVERNKNWTPQLKKLLETPGHHLVAVGVAHLVGEDSVIKLMKDDGVVFTRAQ